MNIIEWLSPIQSGSAGCGRKVDMKNAVESIQGGKNIAAQEKKRWRGETCIPKSANNSWARRLEYPYGI